MNGLNNRGTFLLSIDTELGSPAQFQQCLEASVNLLALIEQYDIHATWAVQGNMLVDRNEFNGEKPVPGDIPDYRKLFSTELLARKPDARYFYRAFRVPSS